MTEPRKRKTEFDESGKRRKRLPPNPKIYEMPDGIAHLHINSRRIRIPVLLDSGANVFLINQQLVTEFQIPTQQRQRAMPLSNFSGDKDLRSAKEFTNPITLEIGQNHHQSKITCEIATLGNRGLIIPSR